MNDLKFILKDNSYIGIVVILDHDLNIISANKRFLEMTEYHLHELKDKKFPDLILPKDKSIFYDGLYDNLVTQDITIKLYNKTGAFRFYSLIIQSFDSNFVILGNPIKKEFIGYDYHSAVQTLKNADFSDVEVEDISDFIGFETGAFKFILNTFPMDIWIKNRYGKYIFVNSTYTSHTGHTQQKAQGKNDYQLFDLDIAKEFESSDNTAIQSKEVLNYIFESKSENLLTWTEVTKIPVFNNKGAYIGIIGFSIDISSYKNLESEYKKSSFRYQELIKRLDELVFEISNKGDFIFLSGALIKELNIDIDQSTTAKDILDKFGTGKDMEKIILALNGEEVQLKLNINGIEIQFDIYPMMISENTYNLIGFGKKVKNDE